MRLHQQLAFRTALVFVRNVGDAEEAAQDAFVKAWGALPRFDRGRPFRPWLLAIVANEAPVEQGLAPLLIGLLVLGIGLSLGGPTGYAINPARDLGPRIMHAILPIAGKGPSDWGYAWIPVVGPLVGGGLGALAFDLFFPG